MSRGERDWDGRSPEMIQTISRNVWQDPTSLPHIIINLAQPTMVVEGRLDDDMVLDQYPGFDLSISDLCHALKTKLAKTRDSRCAYTAAHNLLFQ